MGEFQRSRSKVWWSNLEADIEDDRVVGWGGAGHVLSPSRGSSSSPSSSHKSQDSGFSDSEASSTPTASGESFKPSPLPSEEPDCNVSPAQHPQDVTGLQRECGCPQTENKVSEEPNLVLPKSPVSKLKRQVFSQCVCLGETSRNDIRDSTIVQAAGQIVGTSEFSQTNIECPAQLPVKILREKFLQECMCLNQAPESSCVPERADKSPNKPTSPLRTETQTCQRLPQSSSEECTRTDADDVSKQYLQQREDHKELSSRETSSKPDECVNSIESLDEHNLQNRSQNSLNRSVPVPTIRTPPRNQKESPSKSVRESPVPSPRSLNPNHSHCNTSKLSPTRPSAEGSNNVHSSSKETNKNTNLSVETLASQGCSRHQRTPLPNSRSPKSLSHQSPAGESTVRSPRTSSNREESPSVKPLCSELPEHLGSPTHTSTPKTSSTTTPNKLLVTPNRPLRCPGSGKKYGRPVNLLNNFSRGLQPESTGPERNPVQRWLGELATLYEPECMTTLQSKSLAVDLKHQVAMMAAAATNTVKMLQEGTRLISTEFAKLCQ
ncbi:hypothetical protein B7P43_G03959 [Cryptotermes secundus]|nr:hypothetical protein B7P43_G03959 [Cryptotermes secundus]